MTFGTLPGLPTGEIAPAFGQIVDELETIRFISDYIRCSTRPYQNLVHQYKLDSQFRRISQRLKARLPGFEPKEEIHISLMYGYVPCDTAEKKGAELEARLPFSTRISEIQIIGLAEEVADWRILHRHPVM